MKAVTQAPGAQGPSPRASGAAAHDRVELERELLGLTSHLRGVYGDNWERVPVGWGARAARASDILSMGLVPVQARITAPVRVLQELEPFVRFTLDTAAELAEQVSLLGEVLGAELSAMAVGDLRLLARAIFELSDAPAADPSWSRPQAAASASVALAALGDEVRAIAAAHQQLQRDFTDEVWNLPVLRQHEKIDRWWQWRSRRRVRGAFALVSRTGRSTGDVRRLLATMHEISELRERMDGSWAPLRANLGRFASTPIPDVDGAASALSAICQLQSVLGDLLDPVKLADLAAADAFVAEEVTRPAEAIADAVAAWGGLAKRIQCVDPLGFTVRELAEWAQLTAESLDVLRFLHGETAPLRSGARSLAETFEDAMARDRVRLLRDRLGMDRLIGELEP